MPFPLVGLIPSLVRVLLLILEFFGLKKAKRKREEKDAEARGRARAISETHKDRERGILEDTRDVTADDVNRLFNAKSRDKK